MRMSTALASRMSNLLARLHPPSPPTAGESQRLLSLLQGSMRKKLDSEHPNPFETVREKQVIPVDRIGTSRNAASSHFTSVLHNPLLDNVKVPNNIVDRLGQVLFFQRPDFLATVATLIQGEMRLAKFSPLRQTNDGFSDRLNDWLLSSNAETRQAFFLNPQALQAALQMLAIEQNESMLWSWLRTVYEREGLAESLRNKQWLHVEDSIVSKLMSIAIIRHNLNDAAAQFIGFCAYRMQSGRVTADPGSTTSSAKRLASAIIFHRHNHAIDSALFECLLRDLPRWKNSPHSNIAFCLLYNPNKPVVSALMNKLRMPEFAEMLKVNLRGWQLRKTTMIALLDASKLSLDEGNRRQAAFFLDFAIDNYPDFLPPRQTEEVEPQLEMSFSLATG